MSLALQSCAVPRVLLTRRLPPRVIAPLEQIATIDAGPADGWAQDELAARVSDAAAIISQLTDRIDRAVIDAAPALPSSPTSPPDTTTSISPPPASAVSS